MISTDLSEVGEIRSIRPDYGKLLEALVSFIYHRWVAPGDTVIDAGVNAGAHFVPLLKLVGDSGLVMGFEANPELAKRVSDKATANGFGNFKLNNQALYDEPGEMRFVVYPSKPGLSHLEYDLQTQERHKKLKSKVITVPVSTLDSIPIESLAFIKMDLEGADVKALMGGKAQLKKHRPLIVFECGYRGSGTIFPFTKSDFFTLFRSIGYLVFDVHGTPVTPKLWDQECLSDEFVAIPKDDPRLTDLLIQIRRFWRSCREWPIIQDWGQCASLGKEPPNLVMI